MADLNLLAELLKRNIISEIDYKIILNELNVTNKTLEEYIYLKKPQLENIFYQIKSEILKVPYKKIEIEKIDQKVIDFISYENALAYKVIVLEKKDNFLTVGMVCPEDLKALEMLKFLAKQNHLTLGVFLISYSDFLSLLRFYNKDYKDEIEKLFKEIGKISQESKLVNLEEGGEKEEAPVIKLVALTLKKAVELKASDIHIEPQKDKLRVRFRIDGDLKEMASLPNSLIQPVTSRVKVLAKLKLDETRIPQDGRFRALIFNREIDFRVASFPTPNGEKIAIRILDPESGIKNFDVLGLNEYNLKILEEAILKPYGAILISGPTGSGKSTTLYAIMQRLNREEVNIVTLEDPVEYFIEGINQSQIMPEIGYDFSSGLRQILRQDPDVIMVGEIRDSETANLAINAALTGHILLSTIHTNNAIGVIPRLIDLGVPAFLVSSALNLMLAQRLVLKLCPVCREEIQASEKIEEIIEKNLQDLPKNINAEYKKPYKIYKIGKNENCANCQGKGTIGRIAIFELFKMTRELSEIISKGFTENDLIKEARRQGMITLRQDGILKALAGIVPFEEVLNETAELED